MKNQLFISSFESCTERGFYAKSMADILVANDKTIIRNLPDFTAVNMYDSILSPLSGEMSDSIDTIIQYVSVDDMEYHFAYKNIVVAQIEQIIRRNLSYIDKLSVADEIWVFDTQTKSLLNDNLQTKTKVVGYPYSKNRIANLFDGKPDTSNNSIIFYTIADISVIENLQHLIFNFLVSFRNTGNVKLLIYIKQEERAEEIIQEILEHTNSQITFISKDALERLVSIVMGNPYLDPTSHVDLHARSHCYINLDHVTRPDVITASYLGKYIISIKHIDNIIEYNTKNIIDTVASCYRKRYKDASYYNEFNVYPRIDDDSTQNLLLETYQSIVDQKSSKNCYVKINESGFFNDKNS